MKTKLIILLCFFALSTTFAQDNFKLSLKSYSLEPDYKVTQTHTLSIENKSNKEQVFTVSAKNVSCNSSHSKNSSELNHEFIFNNSSNKIKNQIIVKANSTFEFSIKIIKPKTARLGSQNCKEITVKTLDGKSKESSIIIESYVPDPNNNN